MNSLRKNENFTFLALLHLFLILGYIFSLGFYSFASFWVSLAAFGLLLTYWFFGPPKELKTNDVKSLEKILIFVLIISITLSLFSPKSFYEKENLLKGNQFYLYLAAFSISLSFLLSLKNPIQKNTRVIFLILIAIVSRISVVINSPSPKIDTFDILQNASLGMLRGLNPYKMYFTQLYEGKVPDYFTYMPISFLITIPSRIALGDIRYTFIIAELIVCLVIYKIGRRVLGTSQIPNLLLLIFLFQPLGTFIIEQSWLDPLIVAFFALFGLFYFSAKNSVWPFLMLALTFGVKQNMFLVLPFLVKLKKLNLKKLVIGFLPTFAVIGLFLSLSPKDFIHDTLIEPFTRQPRTDALTIFSFLKSLGITLTVPFVTFLPPLIFLVIFLKRSTGTLTKFFLSFTIWFLSSLLFFREAFLNQYYFVSSLLILTISFGLYEKSQVKKSNERNN